MVATASNRVKMRIGRSLQKKVVLLLLLLLLVMMVNPVLVVRVVRG